MNSDLTEASASELIQNWEQEKRIKAMNAICYPCHTGKHRDCYRTKDTSDCNCDHKECGVCRGIRWTCENHPTQPWGNGCECGAGIPCSECNQSAPYYPVGL